jgi:hypothetical protein
MPEYPHNARMLSTFEKDLAVWRIESESGAAEGTENEKVLKSFIPALANPKLLLLIFCNMMSQAQGSIANYFPTLVASLGYSSTSTLFLLALAAELSELPTSKNQYHIRIQVNIPTVSLLLIAPPYILASFVYCSITFYSGRKNTVYLLIMICIFITSTMYIIPMTTTNIRARYFSMMFLPFFSVGPQILMYKTINLHLARPTAKRAAASALVNCLGETANIWASYIYHAPPHFFAAMGTLMGCAALFAVTLTVYRWFVLRENRRLDSKDPAEIAKVINGGVTQEMVDLGWRYEMY